MSKAKAKKPARTKREPIKGFVCGCVEQFGDGSPALKLGTNRPLVLIQDALPKWSRDQIWAWFEEACNRRWASVCDWQVRRIMSMSEAGQNDYVNLVTVADLGGGGVLADQMLPYSGGRILRMRLNSRITWTPTDGPMRNGIDPIRVVAHEVGHLQGHQHWPVGSPDELMEPTVSNTIIGPQPTEGKISASWFGPPRATPPAPVPGTPKTITLKIVGEVTEADVPGYRVTKLPN